MATTASTAPDLVLLSLEPWDEVWRRNQYLVDRLQRRRADLRVLFVEPPVDGWRDVAAARALPRTPQPVAGRPNLWTLQPLKPLPRVAGPWADLAMRRQIIGASNRLGFDRPTVWLNDLQHVGILAATGWTGLYDITDDWLVETTVPARVRRRRRRLEAEALARCREVVVCSPGLQASRSQTRPVRLVPNGVDLELMQRPADRPPDLPPGPVMVYVGTVHEERLDVDLLDRLLTELPEVPFVVVGPDALGADSHARLRRHPQLHLLGPRPFDAVPAYLQHADVVVIPHAINRFTESLDPIKAYECLAVGTPTVATEVAGFRGLPAPVRTARREELVDAVRAVLADPPPRTPALPAEATWEGRSMAFEEALLGEPMSARRPRVLFVGHVAQLSGGEIALVRLLEAVGARIEAHVVLAEDGPVVARLEDAGARVTVLPMADGLRHVRRDAVRPGRLPWRSASDLAAYTLRLRRLIDEIDPDIVHTNTLKAALYGGAAGRLAGRRVVWHVRDRIASDYLPRPAVALVRGLARVVPHGIVANSETTMATVPVAGVRSAVVHDPLTPPSALSGAREGRPLRVGIVGRLAPWKGQHVFLEAFARAFPDSDVEAVLVGAAMFGEDEYAASLEAQAIRLDIADRVELRGFREDVWSELARLDVLVHCSTSAEPFGQVVVEGMAAGLPVIAADAGGPAEVVTDGVDGLLVAPGDVAGLAEAMRRLHDDPALAAELASRGRQRASALDPERAARDLLSLYEQVAAR